MENIDWKSLVSLSGILLGFGVDNDLGRQHSDPIVLRKKEKGVK